LKDFAQKQGWEIVHQFSDHTSGKTSDREQFKKRFSAASRLRFDVLLFGV
jgi:DNA invertase Pin-like site-specific DNA recombinase